LTWRLKGRKKVGSWRLIFNYMLTKKTIQEIFSLEDYFHLLPEEMAKEVSVTFYPYDSNNVGSELEEFNEKLRDSFKRLGVNIVPYEKAFQIVPVYKILRRIFRIFANNLLFICQSLFKKEPDLIWVNFGTFLNSLKRKRIAKGVSVITTGENETGNLPMEKISSFTKNSIITIVELPSYINENSSFHEHFEFAMNGFAYHLTNIILAVREDKFIIYNFNLSHPIFKIDEKFDNNILYSLIPKIASPIKPRKLSDFNIAKKGFDLHDQFHKECVEDLVESASVLENSGLYPPGMKVSEMPFRKEYHRWIGKIHLDNRSGMSYGFLARQLPTKIEPLISQEEVSNNYNKNVSEEFFYYDGRCYIKIRIDNKNHFFLKIPDIWVLTQRSGCNKTNMDPIQDILKLGIINNQLQIQRPTGASAELVFKPSFDTDVILAHALGNIIIASILKHFYPDNFFSEHLETHGMAIAHWHGYINKKFIPKGFLLHGTKNPHVSCSSPQSTVYALEGKLKSFIEFFINNEEVKHYKGDIHIEPHHGTNLIFPSLAEFGEFIKSNPGAFSLGNKFMDY